MENSFREDKNIFNLQVDEVSKSHLLNTARWTKFLGIVMIIFLSIFILAMLFAGSFMFSAMDRYGSSGMSSFGTIGIIFYLLFVIALAFYPIYALMKFSSNIKPAIHTANQQQFNEALGHMKGLFKYYGILTIIFLSLYLLMMVIALMGAAMM